MNDYTSIEQSHKLSELGLKPSTASYSWEVVNFDSKISTIFIARHQPKSGDIPCWSVADLLKLMPTGFGLHKGGCTLYGDYPDIWIASFEYINKEGTQDYQQFDDNDSMECLFMMTEWLLEHKFINT